MASCGTCNLCCRLMGVKSVKADKIQLDKPAGVWCEHCDIGVGCKVYKDRPGACSGWSCGWLQSDGVDYLRPDKIHMLVSAHHAGLDAWVVNVDPKYPLAHMRPEAANVIRKLRAHSRHRNVVFIIGKERKLLTSDPRYAAMPPALLAKILEDV